MNDEKLVFHKCERCVVTSQDIREFMEFLRGLKCTFHGPIIDKTPIRSKEELEGDICNNVFRDIIPKTKENRL